MNYKYIFISIATIIAILFIINYNANKSFAYKYSNYNYNLFYKKNKKELEDETKEYLNDINKYIFRNSNFETYNNLVDNTEFITLFCIDFIQDNLEQFTDQIITLDNYSYYDKNNNKKSTNKYINIDTIYKLSYKYFGIKNYKILNENINIINNYISIINYSEEEVNIKIKKINITKNKKYINAISETEEGSKYNYTFTIKDNILRLYNIEVI